MRGSKIGVLLSQLLFREIAKVKALATHTCIYIRGSVRSSGVEVQVGGRVLDPTLAILDTRRLTDALHDFLRALSMYSVVDQGHWVNNSLTVTVVVFIRADPQYGRRVA
mgnify:CR=1 FL=1